MSAATCPSPAPGRPLPGRLAAFARGVPVLATLIGTGFFVPLATVSAGVPAAESPVRLTLAIFPTNDLHGHLWPLGKEVRA